MASKIETMSISAFKATCLEVLERIRRTGRPLLITKRGIPIAEVIPPSRSQTSGDWMGALRDMATIKGDIIAPVAPESDWEALKK